MISLYKFDSNSALLVLNGTSLNSVNALLALSKWYSIFDTYSLCMCTEMPYQLLTYMYMFKNAVDVLV